MADVKVSLGARSYRIVTSGTYHGLPAALKALQLPRQAWVISHAPLLRAHGPMLLPVLRRAGFNVRTLTVPPSERSKSLDVLGFVLQQLARGRALRTPLLMAFGGGVVGDLTGFAAAVYRRGVPYVQLPTTLLAQVDSAIGGKVGVDLAAGKNLAGAFYQPRLVWNNTRLLSSLPPRQRRSGLSEIIKYGAMADAALFAYLEKHLAACLALEPSAVRYLVTRCATIKAGIVSRDERETTALRATLNFGHTLGHALEAATGYARWTHGEAIAVGMCAAADLSAAGGHCALGAVARLKALIARAGLPTQARGVRFDSVWQALRQDKKFIHGKPRWVVLKRIGQVAVTEDLKPASIRRIVRQYVRAR